MRSAPKLPGSRKAIVLVLLGVAVLGSGCIDSFSQGSAQTPAKAKAPYTLHVYEDLVEVPTLVLTSHFAAIPDLSAGAFRLRFDAGPAFRPTAARVEGDDPLEVGVLLDVSGNVSQDTVADFVHALPGMVAGVLGPEDHITVFAMDCGLFQAPHVDVPVSEASLHNAVTAVLSKPELHRPVAGLPSCGTSSHLWDAMDATAGILSRSNGRRVLLVMTDGMHTGSTATWEQVRRDANDRALTIVGLRPIHPHDTRAGQTPPSHTAEDPFVLLCAGTGGLVAGLAPGNAAASLRKAVALMRSRYVLYLPRPANGSAGWHTVDVTFGDPTAIVRPSGVAFPPRGKNLGQDPSTVPSQNPEPEFGTRRALRPRTPP